MTHPSFAFEELKAVAEEHTAVRIAETASGSVMCTEYGARLLGLFPRRDLPNVLWVPRELDANMSEGSWLIGGERLWISPERDFYYDNPRDFEGHNVPADMDPGDYSALEGMTFENNFSLLNYSTNETYEDCFAKRAFTLIDDPYRTGCAYAGVSIEDTMIVDAPDLPMSCWSLAMVYTGGPDAPGTALFPCRPNASLISYFNPIPPVRADVKQGYARFRIDGAKVFKLAIRPEDIVFDNPCKAVYLSPYPESDSWFCVIKRSNDLPRTQQECVDPAKSDPDGPKGAIQSYNSGSDATAGSLSFGEIELQLNKGTTVEGRTVSKARHELLSYAGSRTEMLETARTALGISELPSIF